MDPLPVPDVLQPWMQLIVSVAKALAFLVLGWIVAKWTHNLLLRVFRSRGLDEAIARFLAALSQVLILAAVIIGVLGRFGLETTSLVALLASGGLAIGLALQGSLSHFASGIMLLLFRPFAIGDWVEAGGKSGVVHEIGLFATTLTTFDNHRVTLPNSSITGGPITNYTVLGTRRAAINVGVAYGSDIDQIRALLLEAVESTGLILDEPEPAAVFVELGASSLDFAVRIWATNDNFGAAQHEARKAIYNRLNAANIDIPFNQIVIHQGPAAA
jgi:small conductance mechanosensitive channel